MINRRFFIFIYLFILTSKLFGQSYPISPSFPSANAAALAVHGEIPVSHFTGLPSINIPIYTISGKGFSIPISASYHTGGFNPSVHPSWVGLNWNLNAGGAISRKVNDFPDEWGYSGAYIPNDLSTDVQGYYFSHNVNAPSNWADPSSQSILWGNSIDRQPDVFSFSFLGINGKFYLDQNGEWIVLCDKNVKVEFDENDFVHPKLFGTWASNERKTFARFTLIDEDGIKYVFGGEENSAKEYSVGIMNAGNTTLDKNTITTSWLLTKVIPPSGGPVIFNYERGPFQSSINYYSTSIGFSGGGGGKGFLSRLGLNSEISYGLSGTLISPVYLTSINYYDQNVVIQFGTSKSNDLKYTTTNYRELCRRHDPSTQTNVINDVNLPFMYLPLTSDIPYFNSHPDETGITYSDYNTSKIFWLKLDQISIYHSNTMNSKDYSQFTNVLYKRFSFHFTENSTTRLRLDEIRESGSDGIIVGRHTFGYNGWPTKPYCTELTDHWGFSNGQDLVYNEAFGFDPVGNPLASRAPNFNYSTTGILNNIKYPTGGETKLYYEQHEYSKYVQNLSYGSTVLNESGVVGGTRVKRIENFANGIITGWKDFYYSSGYNANSGSYGTSSGILSVKPKYTFSVIEPTQQAYSTATFSSTISPGTAIAAESPITYSVVTEKSSNGSYKNIIFSNHDNGFGDGGVQGVYGSNLLPYIPTSSYQFERGRLLEESGFFSNGSLNYKKENAYTRIGYSLSGGARVVALIREFNTWFWGTLNTPSYYNGVPAMVAYMLPKHKFRLLSEKNTLLGNNGSGVIVTELNYEYDNWGRIFKKTSKDSKGQLKEEHYTYSSESSPEPIKTWVNQHNLLSYVASLKKKIDNLDIEQQNLVYDLFSNGSFLAVKETETKNLRDGGIVIEKKNFNYDDNGNIVEVKNSNGNVSSFVWGYFKRFPVAFGEGINYTTLSSFLNLPIIDWPSSNNELADHLKIVQNQVGDGKMKIATYNIDGSLATAIDERGISTNFMYDNAHRLQSIIDFKGNIIKSFCYNFANELVNCSALEYKNSNDYNGSFTRNNCGTGYTGSAVLYTVPAGTVSSNISIADANAKAQQKVQDEGQVFANVNGTCTPVVQPGPCSLTVFSPVYFPTYSLSSNGTQTTGYMVVWLPNALTMGSTVSIGAFSAGGCKPSTNRYQTVSSGGRTFSVTYASNGTISLQLLSGGDLPPQSTLSLSVSFNL